MTARAKDVTVAEGYTLEEGRRSITWNPVTRRLDVWKVSGAGTRRLISLELDGSNMRLLAGALSETGKWLRDDYAKSVKRVEAGQ